MMKIRLYTVFIILIIITQISIVSAYPYPGGVQPDEFVNRYSEEPLVVYNATSIPIIDGIISEDEWNDTAEYSYLRPYASNTTSVVKCKLKHSNFKLYILFSIEHSHDLVCNPTYLALFYNTYSDQYNSAGNNDIAFGAIVCSSNGGAWFGYYLGDIHWSPNVNPVANTTVAYSQINMKSYMYEVEVPLTYFNTSERLIPFNIEWFEFPWYMDQIGFGRVVNPGMILSDSYWFEEAEYNPVNWLPYFALSVVVAICSSGITFAYMRRKYRKG